VQAIVMHGASSSGGGANEPRRFAPPAAAASGAGSGYRGSSMETYQGSMMPAAGSLPVMHRSGGRLGAAASTIASSQKSVTALTAPLPPATRMDCAVGEPRFIKPSSRPIPAKPSRKNIEG